MGRLKKWKEPDCYIGKAWDNWYVGLQRHRDSDALERANFDEFLERLGGESRTVHVVREGHWACGWIEWIAIHKSDAQAVALAEEMLGDLDDYPALDDDRWLEYETDEAQAVWEDMPFTDRIDWTREYDVDPREVLSDSVPPELVHPLTEA